VRFVRPDQKLETLSPRSKWHLRLSRPAKEHWLKKMKAGVTIKVIKIVSRGLFNVQELRMNFQHRYIQIFLSLFIGGFASEGLSQANSFYDQLKADIKKNETVMISQFQQIHADPELGFQEHNTAKIVAESLRKSGYEVHTGIGETGVVGLLKNGPGPVILFRGDMDALPMKELTKIPYASKKVTKGADGVETPVAHTCGHDAHTVWLMEVARQMARTKSLWSGTLVVVAQPAEELIMGARAMVEAGMYKFTPKPDVVISGHTSPTLPAGKIGLREGRRLTGSTSLDITIRGVGGHGSSPHLAKDPVLMGSLAVVEYQSIVSRAVDPAELAVLTVGAFQAGSANNIIPEEAVLKLNLRWFEEKIRDTMVNGIKSVTDHLVLGMGISKDRLPTYKIWGGAVPVVNDLEAVKVAKAAIVKVLGEKNVTDGDKFKMASEDFHLLAGPHASAKVLWVEVGSGKPDVEEVLKKGGFVAFNHNPQFQVELPALRIGAEALTAVVFEFMKKPAN